jgi:hypothetical protein
MKQEGDYQLRPLLAMRKLSIREIFTAAGCRFQGSRKE